MRPYWGLIALLHLGNCCLKPKSCPNPVVSSPYGRSLLTAHTSGEIKVLKRSCFWFPLLPSLSAVYSSSIRCWWVGIQYLWAVILLQRHFYCISAILMVRAVNCHDKTHSAGGFNFCFGICCPFAGVLSCSLSPQPYYKSRAACSRKAYLSCKYSLLLATTDFSLTFTVLSCLEWLKPHDSAHFLWAFCNLRWSCLFSDSQAIYTFA